MPMNLSTAAVHSSRSSENIPGSSARKSCPRNGISWLTEARHRADERDPADHLLPVDAQVVADDGSAVRPTAQDGSLQAEGGDHGVHVLGPEGGVAVGVAGAP